MSVEELDEECDLDMLGQCVCRACRDAEDRDRSQRGVAGLWTTRNGGNMRMNAMTDAHLRNALRVVARNCESRRECEIFDGWAAAASMSGDAASYHAGHCAQDMDDALRQTAPEYLVERYSATGRDLMREWARRGFDAGSWLD